MEVYAHSTIPAKPLPYLHLGYTVAIAFKRTPAVPGVAEVQVLCIVAVIAGLVLLSDFTKNAPKWRKAGWITLITSVVFLITLRAIPFPTRYAHPRLATELRAHQCYNEIFKTASSSTDKPFDLAKFRQTNPDLAFRFLDGWEREMRVTPILTKGETDYRVTSAGADGVFDTADDISYPKTGEAE